MSTPAAHWPEPLLSGLELRWQEAAGASSPRLLRLSLLRELSRTLHAGKSSSLAGSSPATLKELRDFELVIERLRESAPLDGSLRETLEDTRQASAAPGHLLRQSLRQSLRMTQILGPGKLERSDRQWELALACEAERSGYTLEAIEATVPMREVEPWSLGLERALWPRAIVLFTESGATPSTISSAWSGRWWSCFGPNQAAASLLASFQLQPAPRLVGTVK